MNKKEENDINLYQDWEERLKKNISYFLNTWLNPSIEYEPDIDYEYWYGTSLEELERDREYAEIAGYSPPISYEGDDIKIARWKNDKEKENFDFYGYKDIKSCYLKSTTEEILDYYPQQYTIHLKKLGYKNFLKTPYWRFVSSKIKEKYNNQCAICGSRYKLVTHHRSYDFFGYELCYNDLICLCKKCHDIFHKEGKI